MECYELSRDLELCGKTYAKRWFPRIVLIDKKNVTDETRSDNTIIFELSERGRHFEYENNLGDVLGNIEIAERLNYKQFRHNVQLPFISFENTLSLIELVRSEYFCALMDNKKRVWIFGYDYCLKPQDVLINHTEYSTITLRSKEDGLEDYPPLLFNSVNPEKDFLEDFKNTDINHLGEFSDDFSEDFLI